ncbi:MAG: glycosyltransferase family 4 protein [Chlorobi bacterium]|nr:glycosyltransferase family 4 protein [Chlorobiota bacterium]
MKKVLIITYYWPPSGGGGVQRWLKFVKYLGEFGWEPVIYTPENPEMPSVDKALLKEVPDNLTVIRRKIWEPYSFYKKFTGRKKEDKIQTAFLTEQKHKRGLAEHFSVWVRGNLFIPDARKFWIKPSVKYLTRYLQENPVDVIVSTGPPHSVHLIGMALKHKLNIPWLADFRDPWTNIDYYRDLKLGKRADRIHHQLEKSVLRQADAVTVVSPGMEKDFKSIYSKKYHVIPNGYDAADLEGLHEIKPENDKFVLAHIGSLTRTRNPENLWEALKQLVNEDKEFAKSLSIVNVGKTDISVTDSLQRAGLEKYLLRKGYLSHEEVLKEQRKATLLLLFINNTPNANLILTGKLFEYLAARRPIICVGPENGDAAAVISETGAGKVYGFQEVKKLKADLAGYYALFKSGKLEKTSGDIEQYERKNLTKKMSEILNSCTV